MKGYTLIDPIDRTSIDTLGNCLDDLFGSPMNLPKDAADLLDASFVGRFTAKKITASVSDTRPFSPRTGKILTITLTLLD